MPRSPDTASPGIRLPDFLVIGAMKAGTTTLYHDLRRQPAIRLPDKETNALLADDPASAFAAMGVADERCFGEICPDYSKPGTGQPAATAAESLYRERTPPKIVYLVREPIARLRSHHYFLSSQQGDANPGGMTADIEASLRDFPELIETSRYASRLKPWQEVSGKGNVLVVRFEGYIAARTETIRQILGFLGVSPDRVEPVSEKGHLNPSVSRPVATPGWHRFRKNAVYRRIIRPFLSLSMRDRIRAWILPKPPPPPGPPSDETLDRLGTELRPEVEAISEIAGAAEPFWDLDGAIESIRNAR